MLPGCLNILLKAIAGHLVCTQVPVASWFEDMSDTELLDLIPFFERLSKVDNVYTFLKQHGADS